MNNKLTNTTKIQIISMICFALVISSCVQVDSSNDLSTSHIINIHPYINNSENSKATIDANIHSIGISVYTISNESGNKSIAHEYFSDSLEDLGYGWNTSSIRNWPATTYGTDNTEKLAVYAVIPNSINLDDYDYTSTVNGDRPSFIYQVNHSAENQEDVLVSYSESEYNNSANGTIGIKFNSVLSKIYINLKGLSYNNSNVTYTVKSITINGMISDAGRFSFNDSLMNAINDNSYNTYSYPVDNANEWNPDTNPNSWNNRLISEDNGFEGTGYDISLMMIPQDLNGKNVTIDVEYSVSIDNTIVFDGTHKSNINDSWIQGKSYNYNIFLPNNIHGITFSPTVINWEENSISINN